jgi:hypothetical protein
MSERQMRYLPLAVLKAEGEAILYDPDNWREVALGYQITRKAIEDNLYGEFTLATPHIWIPKPIELVAAAAAVAIVRNPIVTRRFWQGWLK